MVFQHNFLPRFNLNRIDSLEGRKYITPEGNSYESVTTFLGKQGKEAIDEWRKNIGEEEANKISKKASSRGTNIHNGIEQFLLNEKVETPKNDFVFKSIFKHFTKVLEENITNIQALEYPVYSDIMKLAGTLDLVADFNKVPSIVDFKTSTKKKDKYEIENYFLQVSIYSYMVEELYKIKIPNIVILIGVEFDPNIQIFIENRNNFKTKLINLLKVRNEKDE